VGVQHQLHMTPFQQLHTTSGPHPPFKVQIISFEVWQNTIFSSIQVFICGTPRFHFPARRVICCRSFKAAESLLPIFWSSAQRQQLISFRLMMWVNYGSQKRSELLSIQILSTGINGISFVHLVLISGGEEMGLSDICMHSGSRILSEKNNFAGSVRNQCCWR